jgi:glycosyltransferase involved in cell wall biosynthesis
MTGSPDVPDVAIAHDYFVQDGGAERVAIELARLFPAAPLHTTFFVRDRFAARIDPERVRPWRLAHLAPSPWFRPLLPAYIAHFSRLEVPATRLVISNSSTFARAVSARSPALHVAYVHSPLRFAWDVDAYLARSSFPPPARLGLRVAAPLLRRWDRWAGRRVDTLVTNSEYVRRRVRQVWRRDSIVIHPPVDVARRRVSTDPDDFYLVAARLLAYKRVDLAVRACAILGRRLIVIGDGPERARLERIAGPGTTLLGHVEQRRVEELQGRARALLVPAAEDFGMAAVEVMAAGRPVVGYAAGGLLETVVDSQTGVLFDSPSVHGMAEAIERLESLELDPADARRRALEFDVAAFRRRWKHLLDGLGLGELLAADETSV